MAYFNQKKDEDENTSSGMNGAAQPQAGAAPAQPTGAVQLTSASANNVQAANAPQAAKPVSSGMAPGFQAYTKANQGTATNNLANAAKSNVQNLGQQAQTSINQATNKFGQKVDAGSLKNRYQAVQDVANAVTAARNVTAQPAAPAPATNTGIVPPAQTPAAPNGVAGMDQSQVNRFQEVINAKYQGPESLRQAGLFNPAQQKVTQANQAVTNAGTAQGREELLRQMYEKRGDYTRGLNKLDTSLLNSSKTGVQNLQNTANNFKNVSNDLNKAQINSTNLAQNRTAEIKDIQGQARNTFTQGKQAEEAATEQRLASVIKDWDKLPEHFREIIRNKEANNKSASESNLAKTKATPEYAQAQQALAAAQAMPTSLNVGGFKMPNTNRDKAIAAAQAQVSGLESSAQVNANNVNLSQEEAAILGIQNGEGLYNLGADAIKTAAHDKEKLISRDEQARQAALSALAGFDKSNQLDTSLKYSNAEKAGTQSAMDALDLAGTRAGLNEAEQSFRDTARDTTITGTGMKKNKTSGKKYYANEYANMGELLKKSGYDIDGELNSNLGNADLLSNLSKTSSGNVTQDEQGFAGANEAYLGQYTNMGDGQSLASSALNVMLPGASLLTGALGLGDFGNAVSNVFGGGANSKASKSKAQELAFKDLQNKTTENLKSTGFENRFTVGNNDVTNTRLTALQQLLANMDKTNKG